MTAWDAIRARRAIREFSQGPIPEEIVERVLNAGRRAGSSKNTQRWDFIAVRDRARLAELGKVGPWAGHLTGAAVAIALVTPDPRADGQPLAIMFDLGQAAENMMLVAWELGIGSVPATVYDQDTTRSILGYPDDRWCEYILSFGYPAEPARLTAPLRPGGRRALASMIHEERW
jgi:nitroreductase